jgi:adenine-specific DNA-methyltransferase
MKKNDFTVPPTQGIKYAGSKLKILPYIFELVKEIEFDTILDGFSGTTRVSQAFAKSGFQTTSCDLSEWSETFARAYLLNQRIPTHYQPIIDHLNSLHGYEGWFSHHYGGSITNSDKRPFQLKNTRKLDAIRDEIDKMNLDELERAVALSSLILALDSVDNTLGHYAAYLSGWSIRSHREMKLKLPLLFVNTRQNKVVKGDVFDWAGEKPYDLAYFDPPYGSNNEKMPPSRVRYNSYYHIWTTVILNDKPTVFGKANRRTDSRDGASVSVFEEFRKDSDGTFIALNSIRKLIATTNARYVLFSYSSGGRATRNELFDILQSSGRIVKALEIDYKKNVMSQLRWTHEWTSDEPVFKEYLFLLEKY